MDEEQKTINQEAAAAPQDAPSTPEKPVASETPEVPQEEKSEVPQDAQRPEVKPVEKRIHKLVDERDRERAKVESLARQVEELTDRLQGAGSQIPPQPPLEPGAEITPEQYQADIMRKAQAITQIELEKERIVNRVNREAMESMKAHPELDPSSDAFDKELSDTITDSVKAQIQANPQASVKKLVDQMMKPYRKAVEKKVAEQTEVITRQASETAQRPSTVKIEEKPFDQLSIKEMEQRLGKVY